MWREGYVAGGDTRFFARVAGHGPDVVLLLHGWPEDGSAWSRVAAPLVDVGYRVVAPDLKGFGRSDVPTRGYDPRTLADEIAQLIQNLHVKKAAVVGHDWGGAVALATAFRHPGRVRALVTMDSPYRRLDLRASWHIPVLNLPVLPEVLFARAPHRLVRAALRYGAVHPEAFTDEVVARYARAVGRRPRAWLTYYRSLSRRAAVGWTVGRLRRRLPLVPGPAAGHRLRVPALVIWGEHDAATPAHLAEQVASDLDAELVMIPDVGHFPHEEDPLAVGRALLGFLGAAPNDVPEWSSTCPAS